MDRRRAREFEAFTAGAAGRLLHVAALLTGEAATACPRAERLLEASLARVYAAWDAPRGEDPYERARTELVTRFAHRAWLFRGSGEGVLAPLGPRQRLVLVLRLYEDVAEEQTAALLGLPREIVAESYLRALSHLRGRPARPAAPFRPGAAR